MLPTPQIALVPEGNADTQDGYSQMPPVQTTLEEKSKHDEPGPLWGSLGWKQEALPALQTSIGAKHTPRGSAHPEQWTRNYLSQILPLQGVVFSALAWKLKKKKSTDSLIIIRLTGVSVSSSGGSIWLVHLV